MEKENMQKLAEETLENVTGGSDAEQQYSTEEQIKKDIPERQESPAAEPLNQTAELSKTMEEQLRLAEMRSTMVR